MLFIILILIILSMIFRFSVHFWRNPFVAFIFLVIIVSLLQEHTVEAIFVSVWYLYLICDYGKMVSEKFSNYYMCSQVPDASLLPGKLSTKVVVGNKSYTVNEHEDPKVTSLKVINQLYPDTLSKANFDPVLNNLVTSVHDAAYPSYWYSPELDDFTLS